jgi:hypothetical protein
VEEALGMTQGNRAAGTGHRMIDAPQTPDTRTAAGATLVCRGCGISGVVHAERAFRGEHLTCHGLMVAGRPVGCDEVHSRLPDDIMVAGYLYVDALSGFALRCTRGGPFAVRLGGRPLRARITAAAC